jgi:hypothetical protein
MLNRGCGDQRVSHESPDSRNSEERRRRDGSDVEPAGTMGELRARGSSTLGWPERIAPVGPAILGSLRHGPLAELTRPRADNDQFRPHPPRLEDSTRQPAESPVSLSRSLVVGRDRWALPRGRRGRPLVRERAPLAKGVAAYALDEANAERLWSIGTDMLAEAGAL